VGIAKNAVKRQQSRSMEMRYSGLLMLSKQGSLTSNVILGKKILETTIANTILAHTIQQYAPSTFMNKHHFENYQEPASLAL
jgi:hypothetical protein